MRKLLGVIGGMGPYATAHFYKRLTALQAVETEQNYIDALIYSKPSIPDRTAFITGQSSEDPFPSMLEAGQVLKNAGCSVIAIPCVTSHYCHARLRESLGVPILNIIEETTTSVKASGAKKVGLLATDGTVQSKTFHQYLEAEGIETVIPSASSQQCLMDWIYKKAKQNGEPETETLADLSEELFAQGAEAVILGCTELSLSGTGWRTKHIDALDALAGAALKAMTPCK